jgi:inner membrane protein
MNNIGTSGIWQTLRTSHLLKILSIGFLVLLLQMPIAKIRGVIRERQQTRSQAVNEITGKWGGEQTIIGPMVVVPYERRWTETDKDGKMAPRSQTVYASFLPETLDVAGNIESDIRYRGIFEVPVYRMTLDMTGRFSLPNFSEWAIHPDDIMWDRAYLSVRISDARAITKQSVLSWNDEQLEFLPSTGEFGHNEPGIHVKLKDRLEADGFEFSVPLELNGSVGAFFVPFGKETEVALKSNWNAPSFQGSWLPTRRDVKDDGFEASWNITSLGRNYPQQWRSSSSPEGAVTSSRFGVNMISPVDHYRMSTRSVKYQFLFLVLTFATLWLFEIRIKTRIHSIQYLFVGAGMCLFYLLELSLAEHIGFLTAYAIASAAVVALITTYCVAVLKGVGRAVIVGVVVTLLYVYLYTLLTIEDFALLVGSIGLFFALAATMFLTRKVDWYSLQNVDVAASLMKDKKTSAPGNGPPDLPSR